MIKKSISILLILTFLISVFPVGTVFAYDVETVVSDAYVENVIVENYTDFADITGCTKVQDGNAMTFTVEKGTETGTKNRQYGATIDGLNWENTGRVELTYTVSYSGTLVNGDAFGMGIGLTSFNGTSRVWILGGVASFTNFKFEDGAVKNKKSIIDFTDTQIIVTNYIKDPAEEEWTQTDVVKNDYVPASNKRHLREILPFIQYNYNKGTVDANVSATISDITVKELRPAATMDDVSGSYLGYDSIEVNYFIPEGYKSAELTLNGEVLESFDPDVMDYGCYNSYFNLYQFGLNGENIPLKLTVTDANDVVKECVSYLNVTEPIEEPSFDEVSGTYFNTNTIELNYEIPHVYESASLYYNGEELARYNPADHAGGQYSFSLDLGEYDFFGEDLPIELRVRYGDRDDDVIVHNITVNESYPEAGLEVNGSEFVEYESVTAKYILPDDYTTATLTYNGEVVAEHKATDDKPGKYTLDIEFADFEVTGEDVPLTLTVKRDGSDDVIITEHITVVEEITEPGFTDVSGEYNLSETINVNFVLPHRYQIAELIFNGKVIGSYEPDSHKGGAHSEALVLANYKITGENLPITLRVSCEGKPDAEFTSNVSVFDSYPNAELSSKGGTYIEYDTINSSYILPDDYKEATLTFNGEIVKKHLREENRPGKYTADIYVADYLEEGKDVPLALNITMKDNSKKELKANFDILKVMGISEIVNEDFEDEVYDIPYIADPAATPDKLDSTTFDSTVFFHEFKETKYSRAELIKRGINIRPGQCMDISWDTWMSNTKIAGGLHGKKDGSTWYSGAQRFQRDGKILDTVEYPIGEWHHVLYRLLPASITESGKPEFHIYLNGEYVGKTESLYNGGIQQIAIDYENGYATGKMYIDNVRLATYSPMYTAKAAAADGSEEVGYTNPEIKVNFNQGMAPATITKENVVLYGFNGAVVDGEYSYDEASHVLTIKPSENLVPGKTYTLKLSSGVATELGAYYDDGYELSFNTKKAPFRIGEVTVPSLTKGSEFDVSVDLANDNGSTQNAKVVAAIYVDGKLESIATKDASGSYTTKNLELTLKAPAELNGDVKVCTYLVDGTSSFAVIDWVEK